MGRGRISEIISTKFKEWKSDFFPLCLNSQSGSEGEIWHLTECRKIHSAVEGKIRTLCRESRETGGGCPVPVPGPHGAAKGEVRVGEDDPR